MATSAASIALQLQKLSNEATKKSFEYNTKEANTARAWQREMSDTSHQREVKDLIKAGLNPVLSSGGSGAQSYTTSSASAQAENAANAVGNVWSSQIGADATRAAAAQSAAATRYAAAQQASAARYAAAMQYQAQADSWKWKTDYMKEEYKNKIKVENVKGEWNFKVSGNSIGGIVNKALEKTGAYDVLGTTTVKGLVNKAKLLLNDPKKFFSEVPQGGKILYSQLNRKGTQIIDNQLRSLGITVNTRNRNLLLNGMLGSSSSLRTVLSYVPKPKKVSRPGTSAKAVASNHKTKGIQR